MLTFIRRTWFTLTGSSTNKIKEEFFSPINSFKSTVFLCGADINQKSKVRFQVTEALNDFFYKFWFDLIFPENIFEELLYSSKSKDLLSLENLLADSVDVIGIVPESPGSFAELGAFANNEKLRKKIVCILDKKYKKDKSFINQGPVKLIKEANKVGVLFIDTSNITNEISKITSAFKRTANSNVDSISKVNLLNLDNFLLPTIYLLEPVNEKIIANIVGEAVNETNLAYEASKTALSLLTKKNAIENTIDGYKLTKYGIKLFEDLRSISPRIKIQDKKVALDDLRLEILNLKYRNKKMKI